MADLPAQKTGYRWEALEQQAELAERGYENQMEIAEGNWATQRYGIDKQYKLGMKQLQFQRQRMRKLEIPELELRKAEFEFQKEMAEKHYQLTRAQLGFQIVQFEASLGGPDNWVQAANAARGIQGAGLAQFVKALQTNQAAGGAFGASTGDLDSNKQTMESLMAKLTGEGGAASSAAADAGVAMGSASVQDDPTYQGIKQILGRGGRGLAAGTLESLDQDEISMMSSVAKDTNLGEAGFMRWLRDYQRSRVGTENPGLA